MSYNKTWYENNREKYKQKHRQYSKERLQWLEEKGYCHKCGKNKQFGNFKFCPECLEKMRLASHYDPEYHHNYQTRRRELYHERKAKGICVHCSKPATMGVLCQECYIKRKKYLKSKEKCHNKISIHEYRRNNNLCCFCGDPIEEERISFSKACGKCAEHCSENARNQENNYFRKTNHAMYI